jgi:transcriptional antiterminator NusG
MSKKWFVLRVQSGKEDTVRRSLEKRVNAEGAQDVVASVLVPTESVAEIKAGKRRVRERKKYPGYIFVELEVCDQDDNEKKQKKDQLVDKAWYLIRETSGIGDFVGPGSKPAPMTEREVEKMLGDAQKREDSPQVKIDFRVGDSVKIKQGPFENFDGMVEEVMPNKGLVKVVVTIFGRPTPVELEYWQIEAN